MSGEFERAVAETVDRLKLLGWDVTPWCGVANKLKEMGYVVVEYADGICGTSYTIYEKQVSLSGYTFQLGGKHVFIHTSRGDTKYRWKLINDIIYKMGKSPYNYDVWEYFTENVKRAELYCDTAGYKINGNHVEDIVICSLY